MVSKIKISSLTHKKWGVLRAKGNGLQFKCKMKYKTFKDRKGRENLRLSKQRIISNELTLEQI